MGEVRLIDANALKDIEYINKGNFNTVEGIREWIDNAPTVHHPNCDICEDKAKQYSLGFQDGYLTGKERPQGEWVRKEDIIHYIATQYNEHNELVPVWLSIGDLKGGEEE